MRIIGGQFRGRQLKSPTWDGLRPTSDRLRETLFNILGPSIGGALVLDGFAGTGAVGIEALSRGAAHVTFVDENARAVRLIETNLGPLGTLRDVQHVIIRARFADAVRLLAREDFDLIVLDPPYGETAVAEALGAVTRLMRPSTRLAIEHATRHAPPAAHEGMRLQRTVKAGDSSLSFYEQP